METKESIPARNCVRHNSFSIGSFVVLQYTQFTEIDIGPYVQTRETRAWTMPILHVESVVLCSGHVKGTRIL